MTHQVYQSTDETIPLECYISKLKACLVTEFSYAMLTNQTDKLKMIWNCNNYLFTMKSNDLIFKF